jgi:leucyl/phenylalanyl-tRNA--protein transferase
MAYSIFPPVDLADEHGILAVGGTLEPGILIEAYSKGIFPWPIPEYNAIPWFCPPERAILFFNSFILHSRTARRIRNSEFSYACNTAFREVIEACSSPVNRRYKNRRESRHASWITEEMKDAYTVLHELGYCHSIEVFYKKDLVGGLYGVSIGKSFAAESMFYRMNDASKAALHALIQVLSSQGGTFIDCQELNPHLESLGVYEISRDDFMVLLEKARESGPYIFKRGPLKIIAP